MAKISQNILNACACIKQHARKSWSGFQACCYKVTSSSRPSKICVCLKAIRNYHWPCVILISAWQTGKKAEREVFLAVNLLCKYKQMLTYFSQGLWITVDPFSIFIYIFFEWWENFSRCSNSHSRLLDL